MNNLKNIFPQNIQFHPQKYQQLIGFINKKKPEADLGLWVKNLFLTGKDKLFLLINKFSLARANLVIYFYTITTTTKTNLNMIKLGSLGTDK